MLRLLRVVTSKGNAQFKTIKMVKKIIYYLNINFSLRKSSFGGWESGLSVGNNSGK